ncbi:MAG: 2,3-bisphosphoglycerate-independent phosphoglycerate mutase [Pirellulaceae bacterium]
MIGRGALEATGIGFELQQGDVAIRCNFCTLDGDGNIADRRAGRIATEESAPLAIKLRQVSIPGVEIFVEPVKEHRFVVVFRGEGLGGNVLDTDPQATGVPPLDPVATNDDSLKTVDVAKQFLVQARKLLADQPKANYHTMRGFAAKPALRPFEEVYGLKAAAVAVYPMYKGLARLAGMDIIGDAQTLDEQLDVLTKHWNDYDFFFLHFKYTDSTGEDGNFAEKVQRTEQFDAIFPRLVELNPTVTIVTGDHSTPAYLKNHSWHPVPTLLVSDCCRPDGLTEFNESSCIRGGLGQFEAKYLMSLALANAGRMGKFGA